MKTAATVELPTRLRTERDTVALSSGATADVCRASVRRDGGPSRGITLLFDMRGLEMPTEVDLSFVQEALPSHGTVAGLLMAQSGSVDVLVSADSVEAGEDIALAAAVVAVSWGWDESAHIHVTLNDGRDWNITPSFQNGTWTATILP